MTESADDLNIPDAVTVIKMPGLIMECAAALKAEFGDNIEGADDEAWIALAGVSAMSIVPNVMKQLHPDDEITYFPINDE